MPITAFRQLLLTVVAAAGACFLLPVVFGQSAPLVPPSAGITIQTTPLPASAVGKITEIPLPVDMNLAKQFVSIGFGPQVLGEMGFQST